MKLNPGKLLFPNLPRDLRRRKMANVYLTLAVCAIAGLVICVWMNTAMRNTPHTNANANGGPLGLSQ